MFDNLRSSIDHRTSRFSRNISSVLGDGPMKSLGELSGVDERRYVRVLILAAALTFAQWMALPFQVLGRKIRGKR